MEEIAYILGVLQNISLKYGIIICIPNTVTLFNSNLFESLKSF